MPVNPSFPTLEVSTPMSPISEFSHTCKMNGLAYPTYITCTLGFSLSCDINDFTALMPKKDILLRGWIHSADRKRLKTRRVDKNGIIMSDLQSG